MPPISIGKLKELIDGGESSTVEFKRKIAHPEKIAKELVAFANSKGGYLIVGVDDNGTIYGIDSEKYETEAIENCCKFLIEPPLSPQIEIKNIGSKYLAICYIQESENKPHSLVEYTDEKQGKESKKEESKHLQAYIRVGEKSMPASKEMTKILSGQGKNAKPVTIYIGDMERRFFAYLEEHERGNVNDFSKLVNISKRRAHRMIVNLVRAGALNIHCDDSGDYFTLT